MIWLGKRQKVRVRFRITDPGCSAFAHSPPRCRNPPIPGAERTRLRELLASMVCASSRPSCIKTPGAGHNAGRSECLLVRGLLKYLPCLAYPYSTGLVRLWYGSCFQVSQLFSLLFLQLCTVPNLFRRVGPRHLIPPSQSTISDTHTHPPSTEQPHCKCLTQMSGISTSSLKKIGTKYPPTEQTLDIILQKTPVSV